MRRSLTVPTVLFTAVLLIAGCTSGDDTAEEPTTTATPATTAAPGTTVAPPETVTTEAVTSTTMSLTAAIAMAEASQEALNAYDSDAASALIADGGSFMGMTPGNPLWQRRFAEREAWGTHGTLSDCEVTDGRLTCLVTWERTNLSGKAGLIRVGEMEYRFDDHGLIRSAYYSNVSGKDEDFAFEAALGAWMATTYPEAYETFYLQGPEINEEAWLSGVAELMPLIDEFIAQSDEYPLSDAAEAATTTPTPLAVLTLPVTVDYTGTYRYLDVHRPEEPGPWPVVVVAHGVKLSKSAFRGLAEAIAAEGAVVFNIDYDDTPPFLAGIEDVACAIRFARARAADYDGDPARITLVGNSLGAANGVIVGMAGDDFSGDCVVTEGSALIDALVLYEGPYDRPRLPGFDPLALKEEDPELWAATNPYLQIGGNPDLVVRLIHGDDTDEAWYEVPRAVSVEFHQALVDAGYDAELILLEDASHTALWQGETEALSMTVQQTMEIAAG